MCGIIGYFNNDDAFRKTIEGLKKIKERGKDSFGYFNGRELSIAKSIKKLKKTDSKNIIAQNLHAIINLVSQPIVYRNSAFVANCEIYNWKELKKKCNIRAKNDSELLFKLLLKKGIKALEEVRGVYAFSLWTNNKIIVARDILGVKPLWYDDTKKGFSFCSEKKALENPIELNPRTIIEYDIKKNKIKEIKRKFFTLAPQTKSKEEVKKRLIDAIRIRIPEQKFGLLFSGGLDSLLIAKILKDLNADFTAYTSSVSEKDPDYIYAKKAAEMLKIKWKGVIIKDIEKYIKKVINLIDDSDVMKVEVGVPLYAACEKAKKEGCRVIFSGNGADELFGGYYRHKNSNQLNKDCYSDILKIYEKNNYRDDVITMNNNLELRVPFLDLKLVEYGLRLKEDMKIKGNINKKILRDIAIGIGIDKELAMRKKKAAQYGSGVSKAISKLSKGKPKAIYFSGFLKKKIMKLGCLISGGKDGWYSAYIMKKKNYDIACAITMKSRNPDSYMFHTPNIDIVDIQCRKAGMPLISRWTEGKKEDELKDLKDAIKEAVKKYKIEGIVSGALYSNYQRERIEKIADELNLKIFSPLWHIDQEQEMRQLLKEGFKIIFSSIAGYGLGKEWLGKEITEKDIDKLVELNKEYGINIAGEGGEFESLVVDCPLFKEPLKIKSMKITMEDENTGRCNILVF